ncbi:MAG: GAF domain-containing protein, partial [Terriglobales bacterium]
MADSKQLKSIVEGAVAEAFERHGAELRKDIVKKVLEELESVVGTPPGGAPTDVLNAAVSSIQDGEAQPEILRALLEGAAKFSGRAALFVIRGSTATGWQARGFDDDDGIKKLSVDTSEGLASRAVQDRMPVAAAAAEFDSKFVSTVGNPTDGNAVVLPLVVKEKVAALVYADAGTADGGSMDPSALHLLVRSAGQWLEMLALRKAGGGAAATELEREAQPEPPPKAAARAAEPPPPPPPPAPSIPAEDEEVHKKAKRFAKLLVDEIKLYNQAKVAEGRQNRDLYDRLKEDIEQSRATYEKRYGQTPASSGDYFTQEVIRILAENDASL